MRRNGKSCAEPYSFLELYREENVLYKIHFPGVTGDRSVYLEKYSAPRPYAIAVSSGVSFFIFFLFTNVKRYNIRR